MDINTYLDEFVQLHNDYCSGKMQYREFAAKRDEILRKIVNRIGAITDDVRKEWFRDYGTMNGWNVEQSFNHAIADALHQIDCKCHPELHKKLPQKRNWSCWHEDNCSCGLCTSCDSSD